MRALLSTIYPQRRRLFVGVVLGLAFLLSNSGLIFEDFCTTVVVATLSIMAVIFVAGMMLFITVLPSMRTLIEEHPALRLRMALLMWFDDRAGEAAASARARAEGKRDLTLTGRYWRKQAKLV